MGISEQEKHKVVADPQTRGETTPQVTRTPGTLGSEKSLWKQAKGSRKAARLLTVGATGDGKTFIVTEAASYH